MGRLGGVMGRGKEGAKVQEHTPPVHAILATLVKAGGKSSKIFGYISIYSRQTGNLEAWALLLGSGWLALSHVREIRVSNGRLRFGNRREFASPDFEVKVLGRN